MQPRRQCSAENLLAAIHRSQSFIVRLEKVTVRDPGHDL